MTLLCIFYCRRGYFESLPAREYLPMFWAPHELALLAGTGVAERALEDREHAAEDYDAHVPALCAQARENTRPSSVVTFSPSSRPCIIDQVQACMCFCQQVLDAIDHILFTLPSTPTACQPRA